MQVVIVIYKNLERLEATSLCDVFISSGEFMFNQGQFREIWKTAATVLFLLLHVVICH